MYQVNTIKTSTSLLVSMKHMNIYSKKHISIQSWQLQIFLHIQTHSQHLMHKKAHNLDNYNDFLAVERIYTCFPPPLSFFAMNAFV